jgi:hypothetical protein
VTTISETHHSISIDQIFVMTTAELATSYAALILADDGVAITVRGSQLTFAWSGRRDSKLTR